MAKTEKITITKKEFDGLCSAVHALSYIAYDWAPDEQEYYKGDFRTIERYRKRVDKIEKKYGSTSA